MLGCESAATALASRSKRASRQDPRRLPGQDLDRDVAVELLVPRPVDFAHPTRAERREDLVGA